MEIELKLLGTRKALAQLGRLSPVAQAALGKARLKRLHAVYFDTPGLELQANGVALRVRREGRGWIQCIKGPGEAIGGLHRRTELEWPVATPTPKIALLDDSPFSGLFKKPRVRRALAPVFIMEFQRRVLTLELGGEAAAELAIDTGEIRAGRRKAAISEAEIELLRGKPEALLDFAAALVERLPLRVGHASKAARGYALLAGEPPGPRKAGVLVLDAAAPAAAAGLQLVQACMAQIHDNEQGFLRGEDPEYLHQVRVGLRRLRVALALPRDKSWDESFEPLRGELQWLSRSLGVARNWDVMAEELLPVLERDCGSSALDALRLRVNTERRRAVRAARRALRSARSQRLWLHLARLTVVQGEAIAPVTSTVDFARTALSRRHHKLGRYAELLQLEPQALHRARIDAKKLRYVSEFFASLWSGKEAKRFIQQLKQLQDLLGQINDAAVARSILGGGNPGGEAPEASASGAALARIDAHEAAARGRLESEWLRFAGLKPYWT